MSQVAIIMGIYIWRKHAKTVYIMLPCETRVIWDTNKFFWKKEDN